MARVGWNQECDVYNLAGIEVCGTRWFGGTGSKERMQAYAREHNHAVQLAVTEPQGKRGYMSYDNWHTAVDNMMEIPEKNRHVSEIVQVGKKCKPYYDFDGKDLPESLSTYDAVIERANKAIMTAFEEKLGVILSKKDFIWLESGNQDKLSLHCIVCTKWPQYVFKNNFEAKYAAEAIRLYDVELYDQLVDRGVYDTDRGIRLIGSSKYEKSYSVLKPLRYNKSTTMVDSVISYIEDSHRVLKLRPDDDITKSLHTVSAKSRTPRQLKSLVGTRNVQDTHLETRVLELMSGIHPTAFRDWSHGNEDPYDMLKGIKYNFRDRSEPCFTGHVHSGSNNLACWVDSGNDVWVRCFSAKCNGSYKRLGPLFQEDLRLQYLQDAIHIDNRFLTNLDGTPVGDLSPIINDWLAKRFKCLSIKSITGSGKTTLLKFLMNLPQLKGQPILYLVHRITLAFNVTARLPGLENYIDLDDESMSDRKAQPAIACQLDSIHKTAKHDLHIPRFKLVILDESESLFNHFTASTLDTPGYIMEKTKRILSNCDYILSCDALWGAQSFEMLNDFGISQKVVINDYRGPSRHYEFTHDWDRFVKEISSKIGKGQNGYIASMSTEALHRLQTTISERHPDCTAIIHTSKTGDDIKRKLADVDELWITQVAGASPTVEAGVDHSRPHFDFMVGIACLQSTTAAGFYQMLWRVRDLKDPVVKVYAQQSIRLGPGNRRQISVDECIKTIQYTKSKVMEVEVKTETSIEGEVMMIPKLSSIGLATAHNDARRLNSQSRFYKEFLDIAESQGHTVSYLLGDVETGSHRKKTNASPTNMNAEILLTTALITDLEHQHIFARVAACEATEEDKRRRYKYCYMQSWNIGLIDEDFIKDNGFGISSPPLKLLIRYICHDIVLKDWEDPQDDKLKVHCEVFRELLTALNFRHPFDLETTVAAEDVRNALLKTRYFSEHEKMSKVFNPRAERVTEWNNKRITEATNTVFNTFGLALNSASKQSRKTGRSYKYSIDKTKAVRSAALINLRLRFRSPSKIPGVNEFLQAIGYDKYSKYVTNSEEMTTDGTEITDETENVCPFLD